MMILFVFGINVTELMVMDDQVDNDRNKINIEIAELQTLLDEAEQLKNDPEAEIAAKHFRELIRKRLRRSIIN